MKESPDEDIIKYASIISENSHQILHLLNNSMDLFKMEEGTYIPDFTRFNLIEIFKELSTEFSYGTERKSIQLKFFLNHEIMKMDESCPVTGEKFHLKSMFANLIQNAVEASPSGAEISVDLEFRSGRCMITIHNEGTIPEDIQKSFFEKYVTSGKQKGTGLGTYSALLIAKSHSGDISFQTSDKTGTDIIITLPAQ